MPTAPARSARIAIAVRAIATAARARAAGHRVAATASARAVRRVSTARSIAVRRRSAATATAAAVRIGAIVRWTVVRRRHPSSIAPTGWTRIAMAVPTVAMRIAVPIPRVNAQPSANSARRTVTAAPTSAVAPPIERPANSLATRLGRDKSPSQNYKQPRAGRLSSTPPRFTRGWNVRPGGASGAGTDTRQGGRTGL